MPHRPKPRRQPAIALALALGLAAFVLAGCAGSDDAASTAAESADSDAVAERSVAATDSGAGSAASASNAAAEVPAAPPLRLRAVTGELVVRLDRGDRLADARRRATDVVDALGGFVFAQDATFAATPAEGPGTVTLTLKLPPDRFDDAVDQLSDLGTPLRSTVDTTDVTDQVVDLDARIASATASVTRVRALLAEATNLGEVATLEGELTRRETTLEQLVGQRRQTVGAVELSTLTLTLEPAATTAAGTEDGDGWLASLPGFGSALRDGWGAFTSVVRLLAALVGWAAPFLVLAAVATLAARLRPRRRLAAAGGPAPGRDGEI